MARTMKDRQVSTRNGSLKDRTRGFPSNQGWPPIWGKGGDQV